MRRRLRRRLIAVWTSDYVGVGGVDRVERELRILGWAVWTWQPALVRKRFFKQKGGR